MLPTHISGLPLAKKADFVFAYSPDNEEVDILCSKFSVAHPGISLSHMHDAYTRSILLSYAIELKEPSGDQSEASMQLAVFQSALLNKIQALALLGRQDDWAQIPPLLGWTVMGHEWKPYISSILEDGIVSVGKTFFPQYQVNHCPGVSRSFRSPHRWYGELSGYLHFDRLDQKKL